MGSTTKTFDKAPAGLPLMVKAALPAIPVVGSLPGVKHHRGGLPEAVLQISSLATDLGHLAAYEEICGFGRTSTLPATYLHNQVHTLIMALMTDTAFPFAPMGAVHLRNSITQHRPVGREELGTLATRASGIKPHPKGSLAEFTSTFTVGGETVWSEIMTVFFRGKPGGPEEVPAPLEGVEAPDGVVHWKLAADLGRRFAKVSGDYNPIHLTSVTAKAFGFPRQIAHGMWTKAHCLAAVANRLPDAYTVDVEFKKPILLPGTAVFGTESVVDDLVFGVRNPRSGAPHLVGRIVPA